MSRVLHVYKEDIMETAGLVTDCLTCQKCGVKRIRDGSYMVYYTPDNQLIGKTAPKCILPAEWAKIKNANK